MADVVTRIIIDDSDAIRSLNDQIKLTGKVEQSYNELGDATMESMTMSQDEIAQTNVSLKKYEKTVQDASDETEKAGVKVRDFAGDVKFLGFNLSEGVRSLRDLGTQLKSYVTQTKTAEVATGNLRRAWVIFNNALKVSVIGVIVTALAAFTNFVQRATLGIEGLQQATAGFNAVLDQLANRVSRLLSGELNILDLFDGLGSDIADAATAAAAFTKELQRAEKNLDDVRLANAANRKEIAELKKVYEDTTVSINDRIKAATAAFAIEQEGIDNLVDALERRFNAELALAQLDNDITPEERSRLAELGIELEERRTESIEKQIEINNALNNLRREGIAIRRQEIDLIIGTTRAAESVQDRINEIETSRLTGIEKIAQERRNQISAESTAVLNELSDFQTNVQRLINDGQLDESFKTSPEYIAYLENVEQLLSVLSEDFNDVNRSPEVIAARISVAREALTGLTGLVQEIAGGVGELLSAELDAERAILDQIRERTDVVESELDRELELREQGRANVVDLKKRELAELEEEERKSEERARELRRQQLNAQLVADSASQLSNVATAATGFFAANANIPIVGIGVAIAAIGAMFTLLAGIRSRTAALQESFSEGGFIGRPGTSWRTDKGNRGHRVEGSNVVLGGDEYVINGRTTQLQRSFLDDMNSGLYDGVNLAAMFRDGFSKRSGVIDRRGGRRNREAVEQAMSAAVSAHTNRLIGYMGKKKQIVAVPPGSKLIEFDDRDKVTSTFKG